MCIYICHIRILPNVLIFAVNMTGCTTVSCHPWDVKPVLKHEELCTINLCFLVYYNFWWHSTDASLKKNQTGYTFNGQNIICLVI